MTLTAYHGQEKIKKSRIAKVRRHRLADNIVHGQYWKNGKGCAVGCTVELGQNDSPHAAYETELGIPAWVAHLEDYLFEQMKNGDAQKWPERLLKAIPVGACNWDEVEHEYHHWLLVDPEAGVLQYAANASEPGLRKQIEDSINTVADLHKRRVPRDSEEFSAAWSAWSAAWSAESAAWSAWSAWSAARSAAIKRQADKLIELLESMKTQASA